MEIRKFIAKNKDRKLRIVVIGDCMIDEYKYGRADRVSPEFPVPILTTHEDSTQQYPGGAGNVCYQMKHFNIDAYLIGFLDGASRKLYGKHKFDISRCIDLRTGFVPRKVRFYDGDFPLHRWDIEQALYGEEEDYLEWVQDVAFRNFASLADTTPIDAVILSDYNKGFWSDELAQKIIKYCNENDIISVVDPKKKLHIWKGCTVFKPNANEAEKLSGLNDPREEIDFLQQELGCKGVVVTQSESGVLGKYESEHFANWNRQPSKEVNSVIGAGDCFAAVMTIALAHGFDLKQSCKFAFAAGVRYVKARHNKPITMHDIHTSLDKIDAKIVTLEELTYLKEHIYGEQDFVFTNGCFDILHLGHLETLKFAKDKGDKLVVGLNSDESVREIKPGRPIHSFEERAAMLSALEYVDFVVKFDEPTPEETIQKLLPQCIVKGGDYAKETVVGAEFVQNVFIAPMVEGYSTTGFLQKLGVVHK